MFDVYHVITFNEPFNGEMVKIKLDYKTVLRFYYEDEFDGEFHEVSAEYRISECRTAVLKRLDGFTHHRPVVGLTHRSFSEVHYLQFCTLEDFNEVDGELVPTWSDNHGDYA